MKFITQVCLWLTMVAVLHAQMNGLGVQPQTLQAEIKGQNGSNMNGVV